MAVQAHGDVIWRHGSNLCLSARPTSNSRKSPLSAQFQSIDQNYQALIMAVQANGDLSWRHRSISINRNLLTVITGVQVRGDLFEGHGSILIDPVLSVPAVS